MDRKRQEELFEEALQLLRNSREEYENGEWEKFQYLRKKKSDKAPFFLRLVGIAAILTLLILGFLLHKSPSVDKFKQNSKSSIIVRSKASDTINMINQGTKNKEPGESEIKVIHTRPIGTQVCERLNRSKKTNHIFTKLWLKDSVPSPEDNLNKYTLTKSIGIEVDSVRESTLQSSSLIRNSTEPKQSFSDFLIRESLTNLDNNRKGKPTAYGGKWSVGVNIAPAFTNESFSMGGGISLAYKLSKKLSIGSGVNYIGLKTRTTLGNSAEQGKHLESTKTSIEAASVPILATFRVNKKFFVSAGVTPIAIFDEKKKDIYLINSWVEYIGSGGIPEKVWLSERTEVSIQDPPLRGKTYIGFLDFSIGYSPSFFNQSNISLAPYVRIPIGKLSADENIKFFHAGMTLRFAVK